jgi:hypothetical protein
LTLKKSLFILHSIQSGVKRKDYPVDNEENLFFKGTERFSKMAATGRKQKACLL